MLTISSLVTTWRIQKRVEEQFNAFATGFNELIPPDLVNVFDERELELLIGGIADIDVEDWKKHTDYRGYTELDPVVQNFWKVCVPLPSKPCRFQAAKDTYSASAAGTPSRNPASCSSQPARPASQSTASRTYKAATGREDSRSRRRRALWTLCRSLILGMPHSSPPPAKSA